MSEAMPKASRSLGAELVTPGEAEIAVAAQACFADDCGGESDQMQTSCFASGSLGTAIPKRNRREDLHKLFLMEHDLSLCQSPGAKRTSTPVH